MRRLSDELPVAEENTPQREIISARHRAIELRAIAEFLARRGVTRGAAAFVAPSRQASRSEKQTPQKSGAGQ